VATNAMVTEEEEGEAVGCCDGLSVGLSAPGEEEGLLVGAAVGDVVGDAVFGLGLGTDVSGHDVGARVGFDVDVGQ